MLFGIQNVCFNLAGHPGDLLSPKAAAEGLVKYFVVPK